LTIKEDKRNKTKLMVATDSMNSETTLPNVKLKHTKMNKSSIH